MSFVRYRIVPKNPRAHLYGVTLTIEEPAPHQRLQLPVWIPGSYLVREFARHIVELTATADGKPVRCEKIDKHTWQLSTSGSEKVVVVDAVIYAWDLSVRAAHLDTTHGFFNGPSVFLSVVGREDKPCQVDIEPPADPACGRWHVHTTLPAVELKDGGFGSYCAASYDELIDHPVEMGSPDVVDFVAGGVPHRMAITGRVRFDAERLKRDLAAICGEHIRMFHGGDVDGTGGDGTADTAPLQRYLFLTMAVGDGYGGLEHRDSTALICKRDDLPKPGATRISEGYRSFLGLCSHEYFHLWNVKRIKPDSFVPYHLDRENYTKQLWAFEGFTSYYDDLALVRSGVITLESWLDLLGRTATRVLRGSGRKKQTLEDSSFDAWIKYYRQDENSPNSQVSYYQKGAMLGMALDITIRDATDDRRSLDDVMRLLWVRHGKTGRGVPEGGIEALASEVASVDLTPFFDEYLRGTQDIPLGGLLEPFGLRMHLRPLEGDSDQGGKPSKSPDADRRGALGVTVGAGEDGAHLSHVHDGGAAQLAGLSAGDVVVAVNGLRATRGNLARLTSDHPPGSRVELHAFRRDELHVFDVVLQAPTAEAAFFSIVPDAPPSALVRRNRWLQPHVVKKQP